MRTDAGGVSRFPRQCRVTQIEGTPRPRLDARRLIPGLCSNLLQLSAALSPTTVELQ